MTLTPDEEGHVWAFLRDTLKMGWAISEDCKNEPYEVYSAKMDHEARKRLDALKVLLQS